MNLKVKTTATQAIGLTRNSEQWNVSVDVESLTEQQRNVLISAISTYNNEYFVDVKLLDAKGNLTMESIQGVIDKRIKTAEKMFADFEVAAKEYCGGKTSDAPFSTLKHYNDLRDEMLTPDLIEKRDQLQKLVDERYNYLINERKKKEAEHEEMLLQYVESYENGGEFKGYPHWNGVSTNKIESLNRRLSKERDRREEETKIKLLSDTVNTYGTEIQKKKWAAGMMERKEVLDILWKNTFSKKTAFKTGDCLSEKINDGTEYDHHDVNPVEKLSDEEFTNLEDLKSAYPGFDVKLMKETCTNEEGENIVVFARLSIDIGSYTMEADFVL